MRETLDELGAGPEEEEEEWEKPPGCHSGSLPVFLLPTSHLNAKTESPELHTESRRTHLSVPAHLEM